MKNVLIGDRSPTILFGLRELCERESHLQVVREETRAAELREQIDPSELDLIVTGLHYPDAGGLELVRTLRSDAGNVPILVFSPRDPILVAERVLRAGARGYVHSERPVSDVLSAIQVVLEGGFYLSRTVQDMMVRKVVGYELNQTTWTGLQQLSDREMEVFDLAGRMSSTQRIADELDVSLSTVSSYVARIKEKLEIGDRHELIRLATLWQIDR